MGDLKPLGSEKLNGDDKLKRILELTYYKENKNKSSNKVELVKESKNGTVYGIVKEKDDYYVKKGLNEQSLDYIGGMFMKNKNRFKSYAEALKRLELLKGQEGVISEATKYVLKNPKQAESPEVASDLPPAPEEESTPSMESPSGEPSGESPLPMPTDDTSSEPSSSEPQAEPEGEAKKSDYMGEVQKYAGKLGQELRDQKEKMESDDIKYVLNMIISAVDLNKIDSEDLEEIGKKFDREEEETPSPESEIPSSEETPEIETPVADEESPESDLGEDFDAMSNLEEFINTPISAEEIDLSKYAMKEEDSLVELDLDEIKTQINKSVNDILSKHFK